MFQSLCFSHHSSFPLSPWTFLQKQHSPSSGVGLTYPGSQGAPIGLLLLGHPSPLAPAMSSVKDFKPVKTKETEETFAGVSGKGKGSTSQVLRKEDFLPLDGKI